MKRVVVVTLLGLMTWCFGLEDYWGERNTLEGAKKGY